VLGCLWAALLLVGALTVPLYSDGTTLVEANGTGVLYAVAVPAGLALVAYAGLHLKCARGSAAGAGLATAAIVLLGIFTLLAMASIGLFVLPATLLLLVAARLTPAR
jgi:hypothetical protein